MFSITRRLTLVVTPRTLKASASCMLACALVACGGGSGDPAVSGAITSATTTAVKGEAEKGEAAKRTRPYNLPASSRNRAMQKLAKVRCERHREVHRADDKKAKLKQSDSRARCEAAETETAG